MADDAQVQAEVDAAKGPVTRALESIDGRLAAIETKLGVDQPTPPEPPAPTPSPTPTPAPTPTPPPANVQAVYWINQSGGDLSDADAAHIVTALNLQAAHLVELWPGVEPVAHALWTGDPAAVPATAWRMYWLPDADTAGALGYHDTDPTGAPFGRVFTRYQGTAWPALRPGADGISISNISSHEAVELQVDPGCQATATAPDGKVWALETADPVEAFAYDLTLPDGTPVSLSDFVGAAFFGRGTGPVDSMGQAQPWAIAPGGYALIDGMQVFQDKPSLRFLSQQGSPAGRTARRLGRVIK